MGGWIFYSVETIVQVHPGPRGFLSINNILFLPRFALTCTYLTCTYLHLLALACTCLHLLALACTYLYLRLFRSVVDRKCLDSTFPCDVDPVFNFIL